MRPGTQKQSQTETNTFGKTQPVPRVDSLYPDSLLTPPKNSNYPGRLALSSIALNDSGNSLLSDIKPPIKKTKKLSIMSKMPNLSSKKIEDIPKTALLARRIPIDMSLPGEESPSRLIALFKRTKWYRLHLIATRGLAVVLVLVITLGGVIFSQNYLKLHRVFRGSTATAATLKSSVLTKLLKGQNTGRVNLLLLGRDGVNHSNPDVTNTIILASIDTFNNTAELISLPGDLWVNAPNLGVMKLNSVWQKGKFNYSGNKISASTDTMAISAGFNLVDQTVSQITGVNIDYNAIVNFQALKQVVDTLGGITLNVPVTLSDPTMAWQNGGNPVIATAGSDTLNGNQTQAYVMSKETTSDADRTSRQRLVIQAIMNKIMSANTLNDPLKLNGLINALSNNFVTDLSIDNADQLAKIVTNIAPNDIGSLDLVSGSNQYVTSGIVNGQSVILPQAGLFNYGQIKQFLNLQLRDPSLVKENAKILILNGTNIPGLATTLGNNLKNYGYNVVGEANAPDSWHKTQIYNLTKSSPHTATLLAQRLHISINNKLSDKSIPTDGADFVIIIGSNEANPT